MDEEIVLSWPLDKFAMWMAYFKIQDEAIADRNKRNKGR